jgi:hypothetical protein
VSKLKLKKPSVSESEILNSICEYLSLRQHFFFRTNNAPVFQSDGMGGGFYRKQSKWAINGIPDIILIGKECGQFVGLEVKTVGGKQSPDQKYFQQRCEDLSAEYYVVRSIEDCQEIGL